jgi:hypothetical protein
LIRRGSPTTPRGATQARGDLAKSLGEGMLYSTPTGVLLNPGGAVDHWKDKVSDAVHAEDWLSDRPGYGLGKILFDVGASAVPGGPALRTTKVAADAAGDAADAARRADVPGGSFDNITSATQTVEGITQNLDNLPPTTTPDIPTNVTPDPSGPPIPPSLVDAPSAPRVGDTPTPTPRGPDAPTPHVPDSTPGDRTPVPHNSTPTSTPGHAQMHHRSIEHLPRCRQGRPRTHPPRICLRAAHIRRQRRPRFPRRPVAARQHLHPRWPDMRPSQHRLQRTHPRRRHPMVLAAVVPAVPATVRRAVPTVPAAAIQAVVLRAVLAAVLREAPAPAATTPVAAVRVLRADPPLARTTLVTVLATTTLETQAHRRMGRERIQSTLTGNPAMDGTASRTTQWTQTTASH